MKRALPILACVLAAGLVAACAQAKPADPAPKFKMIKQGEAYPAKGGGNGTQPYLNSSSSSVELSIDGLVLGSLAAFEDCQVWGPKGSYTLTVKKPDGTTQTLGLTIID